MRKVTPFLIGLITVGAAITGLLVLVEATLYTPTNAAGAPTVLPNTYPTRLIIPSLLINANVQHVGLNAAGNIRTPDNFTDVAWYTGSAVPGRPGVALIDGHVDNGLGLAGVFKHLNTIKVGDAVDVLTNKGVTVHFVVTNIAAYNYQDVPMAMILGGAGTSAAVTTPTLRLITCDGTWVPGQLTYNERLVVTAKLVQN